MGMRRSHTCPERVMVVLVSTISIFYDNFFGVIFSLFNAAIRSDALVYYLILNYLIFVIHS